VDRCALFVDASYVLADGAMAVHGTRHRDSVSWDYPGLLKLLSGLARDRTGLPLLRCYWYESSVEGRRTEQHDTLADLPGLKLRLARIRPGNRGGVETELRRDLITLARNRAVSDAVVISAEDNLTEVIAEVQDLGVRVVIVHVTTDGKSAVSRTLRQECDDVLEVSAAHLRPFVDLIAGVEPVADEAVYGGTGFGAPRAANGHSNGLAGARQGSPALALPSAGVYAPYAPSAPEVGGGRGYAAEQGNSPGYREQGNSPGYPEQGNSPGYPEQGNSPGYPHERTGLRYPPEAPEARRDSDGHGEPADPGEPRAAGTARASHQSRASRHAAIDPPGPKSGPGAMPLAYSGMQTRDPAADAIQADPGGRGARDSVARGQHDVAAQAGYPGAFDPGWPQAQPDWSQPGPTPARPGRPAQAQPGGAGTGPSAYLQPVYPPGRGTSADEPYSPPHGGIPYEPRTQDGPYGLAPARGELRNGQRALGYAVTADERGAAGQVGSARPSVPAMPAQPDLAPAAAPQFLAAPPPHEPGASAMQFPGPMGQQAQAVTVALADAVQAAHGEGFSFGESVARDAPALWLEAVLARKPRMPSDLETRLLQGSSLPIDSLLHDDVRHALRRGFWDALERARR
jgi:hypothetical protein